MSYHPPMCYHCGEAMEAGKKPGRSEACPTCGRDLRCCKNCRFYSPGAHWDCAETIPDPVADKERGNFCDYFSVDPKYLSKTPGKRGESPQGAKAKSDFDKLFGG
jgi:hypothetical protein